MTMSQMLPDGGSLFGNYGSAPKVTGEIVCGLLDASRHALDMGRSLRRCKSGFGGKMV